MSSELYTINLTLPSIHYQKIGKIFFYAVAFYGCMIVTSLAQLVLHLCETISPGLGNSSVAPNNWHVVRGKRRQASQGPNADNSAEEMSSLEEHTNDNNHGSITSRIGAFVI